MPHDHVCRKYTCRCNRRWRCADSAQQGGAAYWRSEQVRLPGKAKLTENEAAVVSASSSQNYAYNAMSMQVRASDEPNANQPLCRRTRRKIMAVMRKTRNLCEGAIAGNHKDAQQRVQHMFMSTKRRYWGMPTREVRHNHQTTASFQRNETPQTTITHQ